MRHNHTVRLQGEAQFTAAHDAANPLTVITAAATARVLGTTFVVQQYPDDSVATVAVHDGKVAVQQTVVAAGEQVRVKSSGAVQVLPASRGQFSFVHGVLTLESVPVTEAITQLDRWYNVDIRLADPALRTRHLIGEFAADAQDNLEEILGLTFNVRVVRRGRVLTLYPK
jgi:transmembrane sensor